MQNRKRERVTLRFIAQVTGVSQPVVSAILGRLNNPTVRYSEETRRQVLEVAKRYAYRPNRVARSLLSRKHHILGLLIKDMYMIPDLVPTFMVQRTGEYGQLLAIEYFDPDKDELPIFLKEDCVDGVIFFEDFGPKIRRQLAKIHLPSIWVNTNFMDGTNCILFDEEGGMKQVISCFSELGCKEVILIHPVISHYSYSERKHYFQHYALQYGLIPKFLDLPKNQHLDPCYKKQLQDQFQALLGSSVYQGFLLHQVDYIPLFYDTVRQVGKQIPNDVAVISIHQHRLHNLILPSLSSIEIDPYHLGNMVIDSLNALIDGKKINGPFRFPYTFTERESTLKASLS